MDHFKVEHRLHSDAEHHGRSCLYSQMVNSLNDADHSLRDEQLFGYGNVSSILESQTEQRVAFTNTWKMQRDTCTTTLMGDHLNVNCVMLHSVKIFN